MLLEENGGGGEVSEVGPGGGRFFIRKRGTNDEIFMR